MKIGKRLGAFLFCLPTQLKKTTLTNIQLCFPELSHEDQQKLAKKNFASVGMAFIETAMAWWLPDDKLKNMFHLTGFEHAAKAFAQNKGILVLSPHFTCLEMVGRVLGMHYSFGVIYRPHKKALINFIHETFRKKHYLHYIPRHDIRQLLRALKDNMAVWYAYDIDGGKKNSVFAPFFGIQTASLTALSRLAKMSGAAVVPIQFFRHENEFKYEIRLYPEVEPFPTENWVEDATRLNAILENVIRDKPDQYIWQYKRFKTRPVGEPRFY